jgi:hypothetical protein
MFLMWFSPWPDDAPPMGSAYVRHAQNLRIFVQISRRSGDHLNAARATRRSSRDLLPVVL